MNRSVTASFAAFALVACATSSSARLGQFEAALAAQDSATTALAQWCTARRLANPPTITAVPVPGENSAPTNDIRRLLAVGPHEPLGFRHVQLVCGTVTLSEATNWYVPSRLTPAMNASLRATQQPFGAVVASLGFHRERLVRQHGQAGFCPAGTILSHRARLVVPDGQPISLVSECYTPANLAN